METVNRLTRLTKKTIRKTLLVEIAYEVLNQVGGIYTVIRSKVPIAVEKWDDNYCLLGPYMPMNSASEFEEEEVPNDAFGKAVTKMRDLGYGVRIGRWLVSGRPRAILFEIGSVYPKLGEVKYLLWEHHGISSNDCEPLVNDAIAFGELVRIYLVILAKERRGKDVIAHFHEWMSASGIPELRREKVPIKTIFTTHATMLGRYLAMNDPQFYDHLPFIDWQKEANHFNIVPQVGIERAAAHGAHILSTVSDVTARECRQLLGRDPEILLPNGINNVRFEAMHEFQNLHVDYKNRIHQFTMAHFFSNYTFDLDKTIYFFTSGRYEYLNKGYDLTLEALARLNHRLKTEKSPITIVMFFITKRPYKSINPNILQSRAQLEELRYTIERIQADIGEKLLYESLQSGNTRLPDISQYVDDYWRLRYRRTLQEWRTNALPAVVTHNLYDDGSDEILNFLRASNLINQEEDRVKIVYHPDFINYTNPLFSMDYHQFVRGCHLGVFPSYYEPWGYTPMESVARGVPAVTSDLAGFGDFVGKHVKKAEQSGLFVIKRHKKSFDQAAGQLANMMYNYVRLSRRQRIDLRNKVEASSVLFDWERLSRYYDHAHNYLVNMK